MAELVRFGVSLDKKLLAAFDRLTAEHKYTNRSQAIANLIRSTLIQRDWKVESKKVTAVITLVYNHHRRELVNKIMDIQHDFQNLVISTQHIHLDHDNCLEIIATRGKTKQIMNLANQLRAIKGVKHTSFTATTSGKQLV